MIARIFAAAAAVTAAVAFWAVGASGQGGTPASPGTAAQTPFGLTESAVAPKRAYFGRGSVRIAFRFMFDRPLDLVVEIVRGPTGKVVRHIPMPGARPGERYRVRWDGLTDTRRAAPDGRYGVRIVPPAGTGDARRAGALTLRGHMYPIRGPHADRGPIGQFGTGRNGGRTHEGFDVNAACGTPLVAARAGKVTRSTYDPVLYGNDVIIRGRLNNRSYRYSHLRYRALVRTGDFVRTGQRIGVVGDTGNARSIGCHLHFELRRNGVLVNPKGPLRAWDGWS